MPRVASCDGSVVQVASAVLARSGALHIGKAAAATALSIRQFERRFLEEVGITPRRYARIVRFHAATQAKLSASDRAWTDIAHGLGYHDQMHMVHDFRHFAGESPTGWHGRLLASREIWS